ncbi:unnamed protein product [Porites lobata]|uniref:Uncharacterized protein n=1 Tax=Porites lobata TaxID=104759 RepID=A0ABN8NBA0_9CNID|nr:unnamed protein product [Porites lobata]
MGQANFSSAMKFAIGVSHRLGLYTNMTCIYFVFGELNAFYSISELMSAEADLSANFPNENQITLGAILNRARETLLNAGSSRVNASNIVVAITSGKSTDDIEAPTINLKASNVTVFAMGVGEKYSLGQLNEMASELDEDHVFTADSWEGVNADFVSEVAKKIYQVVDSCVSSPCYNNGSCTNLDVGYNCTCSVEYSGERCEKSRSVEYLSLGCFHDRNNTPVIPSLESISATYLNGPYQTRENAVKKCALETAKVGFKAFALQDGGSCLSGPFAHLNYSIYGETACPPGEKGGKM